MYTCEIFLVKNTEDVFKEVLNLEIRLQNQEVWRHCSHRQLVINTSHDTLTTSQCYGCY